MFSVTAKDTKDTKEYGPCGASCTLERGEFDFGRDSSVSCLNLIVSGKRKKKRKKFTATTAVKAMARTAIGSPPPVRRTEGKKQARKEKHRRTLGKLLAEEES